MTTEKQISEISTEITSQEKQMIKKSTTFLDVKRQFINIRRATIQNLRDFHNEFEKSTKKIDKLAKIGEIISGAGGGSDSILPGSGTPVKMVGKIITGGASIFKDKILWEKCVKAFQDCLLKDKSSIVLFDKYYDFLHKTAYLDNDPNKSKIVTDIIEILQMARNKPSAFGDKHSVEKISENNGFWKGKTLTLELMNQIIAALHNDLNEFREKTQQEEDQCHKKIEKVLGKKFIKELAKPSIEISEQQTQIQISPK